MNQNRYGSHTVSRLTAHIVWVTKYRYHVLKGEIQVRCRELLMQICDSEDVKILSGVVSKDHVHMHIECAPKESISDIVKRLKGRTSRMLQSEYPEVKKRYWGKHFWAIGYGVWSTGNITGEMGQVNCTRKIGSVEILGQQIKLVELGAFDKSVSFNPVLRN